jgi:hypothetical protein
LVVLYNSETPWSDDPDIVALREDFLECCCDRRPNNKHTMRFNVREMAKLFLDAKEMNEIVYGSFPNELPAPHPLFKTHVQKKRKADREATAKRRNHRKRRRGDEEEREEHIETSVEEISSEKEGQNRRTRRKTSKALPPPRAIKLARKR